MTVKELRTLIDNLDEYIHVPGGIERLKKTVLHLAVSGQLVPQDPSEGTGEELHRQIQAEKEKLSEANVLNKRKVSQGINDDEVPFQIPKSWKWVRLPDICKSISAGGDKPRDFTKNITDINQVPVIANGETNKGVIGYTKEARISELSITVSGRGTIGYSVVRDYPFCPIVRLIVINPMKQVSPYYLQFVFSSLFEKGYGTSIPQLTVPMISPKPIPLPPRDEQNRIVEKVDAIFALIDELATKYKAEQAERKKLVSVALAGLSRGDSELAFTHLTEIIRTRGDAAELRKTIFHLAVSGQLVPQDPSEGTGEELYKRIQNEKTKLVREGKLKPQKTLPPIKESEVPFEIPQSWKWARLADATVFTIGRTPSRSESSYWDSEYMPWVSIADLKAGAHISETKEKISLKALEKCFGGSPVPAGALLYSFKLTIGKMSIIDMDAVHNEAIASFRTLSEEMTQYLFKALEAIDPTTRSNSAVMGKTLNSASLSLLEVPLPPLAEQTRIVQKTTQLLDLVTELEKHLELN